MKPEKQAPVAEKPPVNVHIRKMPGDLHFAIRKKALDAGTTMEELIISTLAKAFSTK